MARVKYKTIVKNANTFMTSIRNYSIDVIQLAVYAFV